MPATCPECNQDMQTVDSCTATEMEIRDVAWVHSGLHRGEMVSDPASTTLSESVIVGAGPTSGARARRNSTGAT